jgi:hypothetical protein
MTLRCVQIMSLDASGRRIAGPRVARAAKGAGIGECLGFSDMCVFHAHMVGSDMFMRSSVCIMLWQTIAAAAPSLSCAAQRMVVQFALFVPT